VNPDTGKPVVVDDERVLAKEFEKVRRSKWIGAEFGCVTAFGGGASRAADLLQSFAAWNQSVFIVFQISRIPGQQIAALAGFGVRYRGLEILQTRESGMGIGDHLAFR